MGSIILNYLLYSTLNRFEVFFMFSYTHGSNYHLNLIIPNINIKLYFIVV